MWSMWWHNGCYDNDGDNRKTNSEQPKYLHGFVWMCWKRMAFNYSAKQKVPIGLVGCMLGLWYGFVHRFLLGYMPTVFISKTPRRKDSVYCTKLLKQCKCCFSFYSWRIRVIQYPEILLHSLHKYIILVRLKSWLTKKSLVVHISFSYFDELLQLMNYSLSKCQFSN